MRLIKHFFEVGGGGLVYRGGQSFRNGYNFIILITETRNFEYLLVRFLRSFFENGFFFLVFCRLRTTKKRNLSFNFYLNFFFLHCRGTDSFALDISLPKARNEVD